MKIGAPIWYGHKPFENKFKEILDTGFDYPEIALDYPFPERSEDLEKAIRDFDLNPAFHAPLDMLIACPRGEIFKASMEILEKCLKFAAKFETLYFNFHAMHFTPTYLFPEIREQGIKNLEYAIRFAVKFGEEAGFDVCLENDQFFMEDFVLGNVKLTLDLGHFVIDTYRRGEDYRQALKDFAKKYGKRIIIFHVHDVNFSSFSDHLALGSGNLDYGILRWLVENLRPKFLVLEVFWKDVKYSMKFADREDLRRSLNFLNSVISR